MGGTATSTPAAANGAEAASRSCSEATSEATTTTLSRAARALTRNLPFVIVPYRWSRIQVDSGGSSGSSGSSSSSSPTPPLIYYITPSGRVLQSRPEVNEYLTEATCCRCYLPDDLTPDDIFNFDYKIGHLTLPPPGAKEPLPRCLSWSTNVGASAVHQLRAKISKALSKKMVTSKGKIRAALERFNLSAEEVECFNWKTVQVIDDGRVYVKNLSEGQWRHLTYEWKNSSFGLVVQNKKKMMMMEEEEEEKEEEEEEEEEKKEESNEESELIDPSTLLDDEFTTAIMGRLSETETEVDEMEEVEVEVDPANTNLTQSRPSVPKVKPPPPKSSAKSSTTTNPLPKEKQNPRPKKRRKCIVLQTSRKKPKNTSQISNGSKTNRPKPKN